MNQKPTYPLFSNVISVVKLHWRFPAISMLILYVVTSVVVYFMGNEASFTINVTLFLLLAAWVLPAYILIAGADDFKNMRERE
jgi:hypothetical protein